MDDIFSTANHMPASVSAGLIEAITIIRDAIRKHGSDSDGMLPHTLRVHRWTSFHLRSSQKLIGRVGRRCNQ